jgi:rhamnosyltransferase
MPTPVSAVCAVVVTYNPDIGVVERLLRALQAQACDFLVVDNASENAEQLQTIVAGLSHGQALLRQTINIGQAAALNLGLETLRVQARELAMLLDQDSTITPGFCAGMLRAWDEAQMLVPGQVGAIGPRLEDPASGRRVPFRSFDQLFDRSERASGPSGQLVQADFLITSGSLIPIAALAKIGLMRADYFIDNVDLEWCFRARSRGFSLFGTDHARMHHRIGEASTNYLVRKGFVVQHNALRFYYSTRNRLHLHRQPYAPRNWRLKDGVRFVLKTSYLMLTSPNRRAYWASLRKALNDVDSLP